MFRNSQPKVEEFQAMEDIFRRSFGPERWIGSASS